MDVRLREPWPMEDCRPSTWLERAVWRILSRVRFWLDPPDPLWFGAMTFPIISGLTVPDDMEDILAVQSLAKPTAQVFFLDYMYIPASWPKRAWALVWSVLRRLMWGSGVRR